MLEDKKLIKLDQKVKGTIKTQINQDPFHCDIDITMSDPALFPRMLHGGYTDNNLEKLWGMLKNVKGLKVKLQRLDDLIPVIESLDGRECFCTMDKKNYLGRIVSLIEPQQPELTVVPAPPLEVEELIFKHDGEPPKESIRMVFNQRGELLGWAVLATGEHGLVIKLPSKEVALQVLHERRKSKKVLDK